MYNYTSNGINFGKSKKTETSPMEHVSLENKAPNFPELTPFEV